MMSIRKRLLIWLFSALLLAGTIAGIAIYRQTLSGVDEVQDYALRQIAYSMQYSNKFSPQHLEEKKDEEGENEKNETLPDNDNFDFIGQIWNAQGRLYLASSPQHRLPRFGQTGISTVRWQQRSWRIFGLSSKDEFIQVAQPLSFRAQTAADIAVRALLPIAALIPALGLLIWFGVSYGLHPLQRVTSDIEERHADSMRPLPEQYLPEEIRSLVAALNSLLKRLSESFEMQKLFIADAAHQLRYPVTGCQLQAEIISRTQDETEKAEVFSNLKQGIARTSRLVEQLLTLARQQPEAKPGNFEAVNLNEVAKCVIGSISPLAEAKKIDLGLDSRDTAMAWGNREALATLLANLIDNAIRYIPNGCRIDVRISTGNELAILEVEDNGPGIPENEINRVFDRFYRSPGANATGSGLGLAIVKSIADSHGAQVTLSRGSSGSGLLVHIELPMA